MGEIHIFCPIPLKGNKSKCRRLGKKHKNGILEGEKVSIESKAGVEKTHLRDFAGQCTNETGPRVIAAYKG